MSRSVRAAKALPSSSRVAKGKRQSIPAPPKISASKISKPKAKRSSSASQVPKVELKRVGDLVEGLDSKMRCFWATSAPDYVKYHDEEWGRKGPHSEQQLYERLVLEGFQSGLSWLTILRKRQNFRAAFANFDVTKVAAFGAQDVERLVIDAGIIRHRGKIEAAIANAKGVQKLAEEGLSLHGLFQKYTPTAHPKAATSISAMPTKTHESQELSKFLLKRGFKFVGPTTLHSTMQACGYVNAHLSGCVAWEQCNK